MEIFFQQGKQVAFRQIVRDGNIAHGIPLYMKNQLQWPFV